MSTNTSIRWTLRKAVDSFSPEHGRHTEWYIWDIPESTPGFDEDKVEVVPVAEYDRLKFYSDRRDEILSAVVKAIRKVNAIPRDESRWEDAVEELMAMVEERDDE